MIKTETGKIQILDCTLRDGGQGLESLAASGINVKTFEEEEKKIIINNLDSAAIDIIEVGCMTENSSPTVGMSIYGNIQELSKYVPKERKNTQIYTGLFIDPDTPYDHIPTYSPEFVDGIRVIMRYSQLQKSIDFCKELSKKGYKVFIQPMLTMRYSDDELDRLIYSANEMGAYALYFVDSFGYMDETDVKRLYEFYEKKLDNNIHIGFHAHNNMENAFLNVKYFVENLANRNCIVDSCVMGMGQGAGNLQTEILIDYLNKKHGGKYDINCVLKVCEIIEKFKPHDMEGWGYSPLRFIPAMHKVAYKYAVEMRMKYKMSFSDINETLSGIDDEMRHRYTPENLELLMGRKG